MKKIFFVLITLGFFVNLYSQVSNPGNLSYNTYPSDGKAWWIKSTTYGDVMKCVDFSDSIVRIKNLHNQTVDSCRIFIHPDPDYMEAAVTHCSQFMIDKDNKFETVVIYIYNIGGSWYWYHYVCDDDGTVLFSVITNEENGIYCYDIYSDIDSNYFVIINNTTKYIVTLNGYVPNVIKDTIIVHDTIHVVSYDTITYLKSEYLAIYDSLIISLSDFTGVSGPGVQPEILIYPNPTTESVNIEIDNEFSGYEFKIIDQLGRVLLSQVLTETIIRVNVNDLGMGVGLYYFKFSKGTSVVTKKLLVN